MNLFRLRWLLLVRWLRMVGWSLPVVALFAAFAAALFLFVAGHCPALAAALAVLAVVRLHLGRRDLRLLAGLLRRPKLHLAAEYALTALLPAGILAARGHLLHALVTEAAAAACCLIPRRSSRTGNGSWLRIAWLGYSPEWTGTIRSHRTAALLFGLLLLGSTFVPYAGFPALALAALVCTECYTRNEPLVLLLLPGRGGSSLLWLKVRTAWRNYFLLTLPAAALSAALHPETAWLAAAWAPFAALVLLYAVLAKYAAYSPKEGAAPLPGAMRIGYLGFLLPPLLPVTLALIVVYARRAEKNLNRYLHDYD